MPKDKVTGRFVKSEPCRVEESTDRSSDIKWNYAHAVASKYCGASESRKGDLTACFREASQVPTPESRSIYSRKQSFLNSVTAAPSDNGNARLHDRFRQLETLPHLIVTGPLLVFGEEPIVTMGLKAGLTLPATEMLIEIPDTFGAFPDSEPRLTDTSFIHVVSEPYLFRADMWRSDIIDRETMERTAWSRAGYGATFSCRIAKASYGFWPEERSIDYLGKDHWLQRVIRFLAGLSGALVAGHASLEPVWLRGPGFD